MNEPSTTPPAPEASPPISTEKAPREPEYVEPGSRAPVGRLAAGILLIAMGLVFLAGNIFAVSGSFLFLGLGLAFLIARVVTGRPGFAVPAGILTGFGAFVA